MENGNGIVVIPPGPSGNSSPCSAGQLLGAARIFSLAIHETIEGKLQGEMAGDRLSRSQWKLLEIFATTDVGNVTEVAAYQGVSTAAASKAVDRLVRLRLLERTEDQDDRRHIRLSLSEEGRALATEYLSRMSARLCELCKSAPSERLAALVHELEDLTVAILRAAGQSEIVCVQCGLNQRERCLMEEAMNASCQFHSVHRHVAKQQSAPSMSVGAADH